MDFISDIAERIEQVIDEKVAKGQPKNDVVTAKVEREDVDGVVWVQFEGAEGTTPVTSTAVSVEPGDYVNVRIDEGGRASILQNYTNPSAGAQEVETAQVTADDAQERASSAIEDAMVAKTAAESAQESAQDAEIAATAATTAAGNAQIAANAATFALSDVEKVVGTLEWIAEHGEYDPTEDTAVVAGKVYYTRSGTSPNYTYTVVAEPKTADIATYYELHMDESVQNYLATHLWMDMYGLNLSVDSANGYRIHQGTVDGTKAMGMYVLDATGAIVASFGANGFQVGVTGESHLVGDYHSLQLVDSDQNTYFHVSDLRDESGYAAISETYTGDNARVYPDAGRNLTQFKTAYAIRDGVSATVNGDSTQARKHPMSSNQVIIDNYLYSQDDVVVISYRSTTTDAKGFSFGRRNGEYAIGAYSSTFGTDNVAQGSNSIAFGDGCLVAYGSSCAGGSGCVAGASYTQAFGYETEASGLYSHSEGNKTSASGTASHAEGARAVASGNFSHAQNQGTVAASGNQTALGKYNVEDANGDYALIIGNGTSNSARSNALTVGWDGSVDAAGKATIGDGLEVSGGSTFNNAVAHYGSEYFYNGNVIYANAHEIDYTETPTANKYFAPIRARDMNGYEIGHCEWGKMANGKFIHNFAGIRSPVNGTWSWKQCQMLVDSSGTVSYVIHTPDAFCEALHVGDRVAKDQSTNVSIANEAWKNVCSLSLAAGTWVIEANVQFVSNAKGRRYIALSETSNAASAGVQRQTCMNSNAVNGASTFLHTGATKAYTAATTLYLVAYQNSGAALNVQGLITAVRIK